MHIWIFTVTFVDLSVTFQFLVERLQLQYDTLAHNYEQCLVLVFPCETFAPLLHQSFHLRSSCQAVDFALKTSIFSCPFPLENLQHPAEN